jgi:hypothetical protein
MRRGDGAPGSMPPGARGEVPGEPRGRGDVGLIVGAVLVTVGALLLAGRFSPAVAAGGAPLIIGAGCLVWWVFDGNYALLLPAGVLAGIGVGLMLEWAGFYGNPVALGLGAGFLAIYALDAMRCRGRTAWWPLAPGTALVVVGLLENTSGWTAIGSPGWPLFLIIIGLIIVAVALWRRGASR